MKSFEYARPTTEAEAVEFLGESNTSTAVLAGGTDLTSLMRAELLTPSRVVDLKQIPTLSEVTRVDDGIQIGALVTLSDLQKHPMLSEYRSLMDVVDGVRAIQVQVNGTVGGDLCHLPNCWYFRNGHGLLGYKNGVSLPEIDDNRYHAIFGNSGPAKFVNASRFAPAFLAWGAKVRVVGPAPVSKSTDRSNQAPLEATWIPLDYLYVTPKTQNQGNTVLKSGQFISHIWLPESGRIASATYDVMQLEGLDWPLASASVCVDYEGGMVRDCQIVMGHVAPIPWIVNEAAQALIGRELNEETAGMSADIAVSRATPLSMNEYKVQLARTAVKRALLKAINQLEL